MDEVLHGLHFDIAHSNKCFTIYNKWKKMSTKKVSTKEPNDKYDRQAGQKHQIKLFLFAPFFLPISLKQSLAYNNLLLLAIFLCNSRYFGFTLYRQINFNFSSLCGTIFF